MTTTSRPQQRYDHRLRDLIQRTGDLTIATDLGVPRSTARGWLGAAPTAVVSLEVANLTELELRQEILKLRRRAEKLVGLRTTGADEMWHIDTTVIRLRDGTRAYLHAVIDNFSRRILAWRVADTFAPLNSVAVLLEASRGTTRPAGAPVLLADAGVENVNAQVDELIHTGVLRRLLAFTELKFANSMIKASWRSLKTSIALPPFAR
jgi:transposase InsO family protein